MLKAFRKNHILNILREFDSKLAPLDLFLHLYFKKNHSLGSNDRKEISEFLYQFIRWKGLIDFFTSSNLEEKVEWLCKNSPLQFSNNEEIPEHIRFSFPKEYYEVLKNTFSFNELKDFCLTSNQKAPVTIRANPIKISRDDLLIALSDRFDLAPTKISPLGIKVFGKANLFQTEEFQQGFFEMQDEASQLISNMIEPFNKDSILDFCAGAGGKTLGFAFKCKGHGQIYLHDVRDRALQDAKKRMNRAGIQNFQILKKATPNWELMKKKMDWIIVDAPCSGSGTLRRNPDQKWKFQKSMLDELISLQRAIFEEALTFLKPKGKIIYATCSVLKEENEEQIKYFCEKYSLQLVSPAFNSFPKPDEMDGFFAAKLEKL